MNIYALKFREKGEKEYKSILIQAENPQQLKEKFEEFIKNDMGYDIDRRTVSCAGNSIPFVVSDRPTVIYANLDEIT